jgi:glutamate-ammonia-ligase adenylyltransferase
MRSILAIRAAITERTPDAEARGFAALALGKHGSRELNYSSDIDPILIFDPATLPHRRARNRSRPRSASPGASSSCSSRATSMAMSSGSTCGCAPRPRSRRSPCHVDAALSYYESAALPWERAAFIRARAAAGDIALGQGFLDAIRSFVWRRSVDFGAVREIRRFRAASETIIRKGRCSGRATI